MSRQAVVVVVGERAAVAFPIETNEFSFRAGS